MASTIPVTDAHENASGHRQPGETCAQETTMPGSQGTNAVHGTWCSEGDAGRHLRTKTGQGHGTPSPVPVALRLERIATQAQQYDALYVPFPCVWTARIGERQPWSIWSRLSGASRRAVG